MNSTYIWEISSKQDGFLFPEIEKEGESLLEEKWGESLLDQWKSFKLKFLDDYGTQQADFYFILGFIPVASESICSLFDFKESDVELLPVYDDAGTKFYVINPCYCDSRILNRRKSKIKYNDDGGVFWVSDPVFYTRPSKPLFKIPEMSTKAYVDNSFVSVVKKHNLQGIDFVPCKIKEESVIDKILKSIHCLFLFSLIGALVASCAGSREEHQERKVHTDDTAAISDGFMSSSSSVELSEANKTSYEFVNSSSSKAIIEEIPSENSEKQVRKKNVKAANRIADVSALGEITISQEMPYFFDAFSQFVSSADFQTADIDNSLAGVFKQMLEDAYGGNANFYLEQKNAPQIDKELIETLMKEGRFEEAQNLRLKIVERYDSNSVWYKKNQDDSEPIKKAKDFIYEILLDISQYYYAYAIKLFKEGNVDEGIKISNKAIEAYEEFLKRYAEVETWDKYKVHIDLAFAYNELGMYAKAAEMFNWAADADTTVYGPRPNYNDKLPTKKDAAYNAVLMMDAARLQALTGDSSIDVYNLPETKAYFEQVKKFVAEYGDSDDAIILAYNAAIVYYEVDQFELAATVLQYLKDYTKSKNIENDSLATMIEKGIAYLQKMIQEQNKSGTFIDSRDGQTYKTVRIGSQIWMAQNLNYKIGKSSCYNNSKKKCEKYGRLYDWNTAMKACPEGWHLPSSSEYEQLMITACGKKGCENELNSNTDWVYTGNNGDDSLGFSALPAGYCGRHYLWTDGIKFRSHGWGANFWASSTAENESYAYILDISGGNEFVSSFADLNSWNKEYQASVRCVKDLESENNSEGHRNISTGYINANSARSFGSYNSQRQHLMNQH